MQPGVFVAGFFKTKKFFATGSWFFRLGSKSQKKKKVEARRAHASTKNVFFQQGAVFFVLEVKARRKKKVEARRAHASTKATTTHLPSMLAGFLFFFSSVSPTFSQNEFFTFFVRDATSMLSQNPPKRSLPTQ